MVITVDMYQQVRQMHLEGKSNRKIAKLLGISRNTVKKYCTGDTLPDIRKKYERENNVITQTVIDFVNDCFKLDKTEGTDKQSHTAKHIYDRLVALKQFRGGESTIRHYVHELKDSAPEPFVPLIYEPGEAMQIDWGEAMIWLAGEKVKVNLFCARLCYSGAPFVRAYRRQNNESFLDALVHTVEFFGGVSKKVIFDNARVAVKKGFGSQAVVQDNYGMLAAHYGFQPVFCNIASGNEKGLVEGFVGYSRRNFCVPLPRVENMDELNELLEKRCREYSNHTVKGKTASVGVLFQEEASRLSLLPQYRYDPAKRITTRVNRFSTVKYDTNSYSVPVKFCGKKVAVKALPEVIDIFYGGEKIASHQRCFERQQNIYDLSHYLPLLEKKGRAIFNAAPVKANVPAPFLTWLSGQSLQPGELVALLTRSLEIGFDAVMRGDIPLSPEPHSDIQDKVGVKEVNLAEYDDLSSKNGEVAA